MDCLKDREDEFKATCTIPLKMVYLSLRDVNDLGFHSMDVLGKYCRSM